MHLRKAFKVLTTAPEYQDEETKRVSDMLHAVTVLLLCGMTALLIQLLWIGQYGRVSPVLLGLTVLAASAYINRQGLLKLSANVTIWGSTAFLLYMSLTYDGIRDNAILGIPGILVAAGLVLDRRPFYVFAVIAIAAVLGIGYFEIVGLIHNTYSHLVRYGDLIDIVVILSTTAIAIRLLSDSLIKNFARATLGEREIRRQAGQLSETELRYRTLFESANDAIFIIIGDKFVECNSMAVTMFGCTSASDIVGQHPWNFSPALQPDGRKSEDRAKEIIAAAMSGVPQRFQWKHYRCNRTEFDAEVSLNCLQCGSEVLVQAMVTDITVRKRAESSLKESQERFQKIFHVSPVPMSISRMKDGKYIDVNQSFLQHMGFDREEVVGHTAIELATWAQGTDRANTIEILKTHGAVRNIEGVYRSKSGNVGHSIASAEIIELDGEPHILSVSIDISKRKKAEEKLRKSEELYRTLVSASPDAITVVDAEGHIVFASDKTVRLFGEDRLEDILGRRLTDWVIQGDRGLVEATMQKISDENIAPVRQYVMVRKDGSEFVAEVNAEALLDGEGNAAGFVSFVRDVTERTRAEQQMEEKEQRYRALFDLSPGGIILTDLDGTMLDANVAACNTNGYSIDELLGKNVRMFIPESDLQDVERHVEEMKLGKTLEHEVANVKKDGTLCNIELRETMISLPNGKKGILSITNDITAKKNADSALLESEKRYRNLVEVSPDGVLIYQDFKVVFANTAAIAGLGLSGKEQILGRPIFDFVQSDKHSLLRERYRMMIQENQKLPFVEYRLVRADGSIFEVESMAIPTVWEGKPAAQAVVHDLSERKKAESAIQESEERFRSLSRVTFEGIMIHENGIIIDANQRFAEMFGLRDPEALVGKRGVDVLTLTPESKMRIREAIELRSDSPFEITVVRPDGSSFPVETRSRRTIYRGRPVTVVTMQDITKRKLAEKALAESEERFRALVQNSTDIISIHNDKGMIIFVSPSVSRILGYRTKDLVGLSAFEFIHPEDQDVVKKDYQALVSKKGDNILTHFRFRAADGSWKYLESVGTNLSDAPAIKGYVLNTRDVTERKRAEEALRESEERFRLLIENSTDLIAEISEEGRFVYVSPNYENILGYKPSKLAGKAAFEHVFPEDLPMVLSKFQEEHSSEIYRYRHSNGSWRWFESSGRRFRTSSGEERAVTMSRDITDRRLAEEELNKSRVQLQRFSERLENMLDEERKRISREIHDELGQLLTILKFDLSWLKLNTRAKNEEFPGKIQSMEESLSQALASVKRISKELRPPQLDELGLVGAIQLDVSLIERKVGLATSVRIRPVDFVIDKQLSMSIYRVFHEILTNIVRHANAKNVTILLEKSPEFVTLKVDDDGRGISSKELDGTMSLGLVGMRERVRQWDGQLTILGRKGVGTSVTAQFPLQTATIKD